MTVSIDIAPKGNRIDVRFEYSKAMVMKMRTIPGRAFVRSDKHWTVPLDLTACRMLRQVFDPDREGILVMGDALRSWAALAVQEEATLGTIALSDTGTLDRLWSTLPGLARAIHLGPLGKHMDALWSTLGLFAPGSYQAADVEFLVASAAPLNALQQGLGKTPEWIAAVWEQGIEVGNHLVMAPSSAVDGTWEPELEMWQEEAGDDVEIFACTGTKKQREATLAAFLRSTAPVKWVVINPQMVQYRKDATNTSRIARKAKPKDFDIACHCDRMKEAHWHYESAYPMLMDVEWNTIAIDECHKGNIRNHRSLTSFSIHDLILAEGGKKCALSGTPMKKKGADIWGVLHWLRPDVFTSFWRFAEMFFEIEDNGFGKKVGEFIEEREEAFFQYLMPYVVRRTKKECAPWLPEKQIIEVPVTMTPKQAKQYAEMADDGIARLADGSDVYTTSVLSEFTRLAQFANAFCTTRDGKIIPTEDSAKLDALFQKLDEDGILDGSSEQQTLIFSQSREMVELVAAMLRKKKVSVGIVSGGMNKKGARRQIKEAFQGGEIKVLCIVTTAGGVSLTLDAADTCHFIDQSWAPDEDEQAEDRAHRVSRIHQVTIYRYIAKGTIDEYKAITALDKAEAQRYILDVRRDLLKARAAA